MGKLKKLTHPIAGKGPLEIQSKGTLYLEKKAATLRSVLDANSQWTPVSFESFCVIEICLGKEDLEFPNSIFWPFELTI